MRTTHEPEAQKRVDENLLRKVVRNFCFAKLGPEKFPADLDDDTDMFKTGIIDSVDALELLIAFEEDHGIMIPEELEDVSGLATISGISKFLAGLLDPNLLEQKLGAKITRD
jgi:acyl carrier protein